MELRITGRHGRLSPEVREYAETKLVAVERFDARTRLLEVVLDHEPHATTVEVRAHAGRGAPFVVSAKHATAEGAIDLVHDKLDRTLRRRKEKARDRHRGVRPGVEVPGGIPSPGGEEE